MINKKFLAAAPLIAALAGAPLQAQDIIIRDMPPPAADAAPPPPLYPETDPPGDADVQPLIPESDEMPMHAIDELPPEEGDASLPPPVVDNSIQPDEAALPEGEPAAPSEQPANLTPQEQNGVLYVTGGVGVEEAHALKILEPQFNTKILSTLKSGSFVSGTLVSIYDANGGLVFEAPLNGPCLLVQLTPGQYTVEAMQSGAKLQRSLAVPKTGSRQVIFEW
jgi:hypothetical protein